MEVQTYEEATKKLSKSSRTQVKWQCPNCHLTHLKEFRRCHDKAYCQECYKTRSQKEKPIPMSQANLSKGSQREVIWTCGMCETTKVKPYRTAIKDKNCKKCNNIIRPKPDMSGENNPFYNKTHSEEFIQSMTGVNNPRWRHDLTLEERLERTERTSFHKWSKQVKDKFGHKCSVCESTEDIRSHHLEGYSYNYDSRFDVDNGRPLCEYHHILFHRIYTNHYNTKSQYLKFEKLIKTKPTKIIVLAGAHGSGKSTILDSVKDRYTIIRYDSLKNKKILDEILVASDKPIILELPMKVSTFIKRFKDYFEIELLVIIETLEVISKRLKERGGKVTPSTVKRVKRMESLSKNSRFSGTSSQILDFLNS